MRQLIKEPLCSFLLLSALIFCAFHFSPAHKPSADNEIFVSKEQIDVLRRNFEKTWMRTANETEAQNLIQNFIQEEALYREALAAGLDKNDTVIRRHLSRKMAFLSEDITRLEEPSDLELKNFFNANQTKYRHEANFSFRQVYFDSSNNEALTARKATALLEQIKEENFIAESVGDPLMIKSSFKDYSETEIQQVLGSQFLASLTELNSNGWHGPIKSSFGLHLIRLDKKTEGKTAKFSEVRDQVVRDWTTQRQKQKNRDFYKRLLERYTVVIPEYATANANTEVQRSAFLALNKSP